MYKLSAFKAYDIRGIREEEIDEQFAYVIGYALGKEVCQPDFKILIASDVRDVNALLISAFLCGLREAGVSEVTALNNGAYSQYPYGICSTPFAYYVGYRDYDMTVIFSASHNSKEYVGLKIVNKECLFYPSSKLKERFVLNEGAGKYGTGASLPQIISYQGDKIEQLRSFLINKFKSLNHTNAPFVVDFGHGAAVNHEYQIIKEIFGDIGLLFTNPDGNFPAHETDTSRFSNYDALIQGIKQKNCEFGFMFDGDADRMGIVLRSGKVITGDVLLAIVAKQLLTDGNAQKLGSHVIFQEVFCGKIVREVVEQYGGELKITRVGRGAFVNEVIESNGLLAGEVSVHMLFKELGTIEMPLLALYYILKESENFSSFEEMMAYYSRYYRGQVLHFACEDKDAVLKAILEYYDDGENRIITIDGVRVEFENGWFCVRKSGTEPIIKVALEGDNKESHDYILEDLRKLLVQYGCHEE